MEKRIFYLFSKCSLFRSLNELSSRFFLISSSAVAIWYVLCVLLWKELPAQWCHWKTVNRNFPESLSSSTNSKNVLPANLIWYFPIHIFSIFSLPFLILLAALNKKKTTGKSICFAIGVWRRQILTQHESKLCRAIRIRFSPSKHWKIEI